MRLSSHCLFLGWACARVARRLEHLEALTYCQRVDSCAEWYCAWDRYLRLMRRYSDAVRIERERYVDAHARMVAAAVNRELSDLTGSKTLVVDFTMHEVL